MPANIKVIQLVRDPRALIHSYKTEKQLIQSQSERICNSLSKNIKDGANMPDEFYNRIRYEDLVESPLTTIKNVLNFVGLDILPVKEINQIKLNLGEKASKWKKELNFEDIKIVQNSCADVLNALNYTVFNSTSYFLN